MHFGSVQLFFITLALYPSGFDPWDVSQQGLADLMEEQNQSKLHPQPHPLRPAHNYPADHTHNKRLTNGLTSAFMGQEAEKMYKHWHGVPQSTTGVNADVSSRGMGGAVIGGGGAEPDDSLQDEFRALFPNVNISFGGRCNI